MSKDNINHEQFLTKSHIKGLTSHKGFQDFLLSLSGNPVKFIPTKTAGNHIKLHIVGDGSVFMASTPSDHRALNNNMSMVRRQVREHVDPEWELPNTAPGKKKKKKKVQPTEEAPPSDEPI